MWISRKEAKEMNDVLEEIKSSVEGLKAENSSLKEKINSKDQKIQGLMNDIGHLNGDLDRWEPLANLIASMCNTTTCDSHKTIPNSGIEMLNEYRKMIDQKNIEDQNDEEQ